MPVGIALHCVAPTGGRTSLYISYASAGAQAAPGMQGGVYSQSGVEGRDVTCLVLRGC